MHLKVFDLSPIEIPLQGSSSFRYQQCRNLSFRSSSRRPRPQRIYISFKKPLLTLSQAGHGTFESPWFKYHPSYAVKF